MNTNVTRNLALGLGAVFVVILLAIGAAGLLGGPPGQPLPSPTTAALPTTPVTTAAPSASASPVASATPLSSLSPNPTPTTELSPSPSASPSPTTSAEPSPSPSASPSPTPASAWQPASGVPRGAQAVIDGGPGFVAVGNSGGDGCPRGGSWTSSNGLDWQAGETFSNAHMISVVRLGQALYAFAQVDNEGCAQARDEGINVYRSTEGTGWELLPMSPAFSSGSRINDVTVAGDTLVAVGTPTEWGDDPDVVRGGVWLSTDGSDWSNGPTQLPGTWTLTSAAAAGSTVVAFGEDPAYPLAWYSNDSGRTWQAGDVEWGFLAYSLDPVAVGNGFVAVGEACCGVPLRSVGVALTSVDGRSWSAPTLAQAQRFPASRGVAVPGGVLALGAKPRFSSNGRDWRAGQALPEHDGERYFLGAAAAGPGVVALATDGAWFLPASSLGTDHWTAAAAPAQRAAQATNYRYFMYTHCGAENARVLLDGSVWLVDPASLHDYGDFASWPPTYNDPQDRGALRLVSADRVRYRSRNGGDVFFDRTNSPPPFPQCA
ncbi:MAG TPA: hypothetical protein VMP67_04470 [Candidatus Limnocylindria bacterium]|nr:hypothetical protein [Candidatus Limnocylindria bacterium]